jgi:uncharacterized protein
MIDQIAKLIRKDGWENIITKLGVLGKDKSKANFAVWNCPIREDLEDLYSADDTAQRIVNRIPESGTKNGISWTGIDKEVIPEINNEWKRLKFNTKLQQLWKWSRLYGGAALFISVEGDGSDTNPQLNLSKPLQLKSIKRVKSLVLLNRFELTYQDVDQDINSPTFGLPSTYQLSSSSSSVSYTIHRSRLIIMQGVELPTENFINNGYWDDSIYTSTQRAIQNYNTAHDSSVGVLTDFRKGVVKIEGLASKIASGETDNIKKRIQLLDQYSSVLNTMVLDSTESYEQNTPALSGFEGLVKSADNKLVAASGLPHTLLLGESPSGLSTTGQSERRDYNESVANEQELKVRDPITQMAAITFSQKEFVNKIEKKDLKISDEWSFVFNPIDQPTEKEKAETREVQSRVDKQYWEMGALETNEIRDSRFTEDGFSFETELDTDSQKETEEDLEEKIENG